MKLVYSLMIAFLMLTAAASALTASIGNARMIINTEVVPGEITVIDRTIKVINSNDVPVNISLQLKDDLVEIAEILDNDFVLQPDESRDARFVMRLEYGGRYEGNVAVAFTPQEGGKGVGLASKVIVLAKGPLKPGSENVSIELPPDELPLNETNQTQQQVNQSLPPADEPASPVVGFLVLGAIVALGIVIFLMFKRG